MTDKFYLVPVEWFERAKVADSMGKIDLVDELLKADLAEHGGSTGDHSGTSEDKGTIDWSKAPIGTTHCFSHCEEGTQTTPEDGEEYKWEMWEGTTIYEWTERKDWREYVEVEDLDPEDKANRVKRP